MTHYLPSFCEYSAGRWKAVCGAWMLRQDHRSEPECAECRLWLQAEAPTNKLIGRIAPEYPWGISR